MLHHDTTDHRGNNSAGLGRGRKEGGCRNENTLELNLEELTRLHQMDKEGKDSKQEQKEKHTLLPQKTVLNCFHCNERK